MDFQATIWLSFIHTYKGDYNSLIDKSGKCAMEVKRLRTLGLEIFTTLNNRNPAFIEEIVQTTKWLTHKLNTIQVNASKVWEP